MGDCCTDDTEQVVESVGDPRVTFVNLPVNSGEQAAPNNRGVAMARGRYVAFLNQDDLYFPDHLSRAVEELERSGADIVWVPCASILPATDEELSAGCWAAELWGVPPTLRSDSGYSPLAFYCASSWVLRRDVCERVGPWRDPGQLYVTPSQDWLFRASKAGATIRFVPHVSVLLIPSGARRGSYDRRTSPEHEYFAALMRDDPAFRERLLESAAVNTARTAQHRLLRRPVAALRRAVVFPVWAVLDRVGVHPFSVDNLLRSGGRGRHIRRIHRFAGLNRPQPGGRLRRRRRR